MSGLGQLIAEFPEVKKQALLTEIASGNTLQSYVYGMWRVWLKERALGSFEKGFSSEAE